VNGLLRTDTVVPLADCTVLEAGKLLYEYAYMNSAKWYGNCGEQAAIALYLCQRNFYITSRDLFLVSMAKPKFQHSLAAFGDPRQDPTAAFCDPWMNIACVFSDYPKLARQKLVEWTGKLKRIASGTYTRGLGPFARTCVNWMEPTNDDVMGFWDGKFSIWNSLDRPTIRRT
jgi:hypothetical protein